MYSYHTLEIELWERGRVINYIQCVTAAGENEDEDTVSGRGNGRGVSCSGVSLGEMEQRFEQDPQVTQE